MFLAVLGCSRLARAGRMAAPARTVRALLIFGSLAVTLAYAAIVI
jgi:hypothetical protein